MIDQGMVAGAGLRWSESRGAQRAGRWVRTDRTAILLVGAAGPALAAFERLSGRDPLVVALPTMVLACARRSIDRSEAAWEPVVEAVERAAPGQLVLPDAWVLGADDVAWLWTLLARRLGRKLSILLDVPPPGAAGGLLLAVVQEVRAALRSGPEARSMALYGPWVRLAGGAVHGPSLAVAASIGGLESPSIEPGQWSVPANQPLVGLEALAEGIALSPDCNPIRCVPGRGWVAWGLRTLDDAVSLDLHRVHTFLCRQLEADLGWAVFEPRDERTRVRVRRCLEGTLWTLWRQGVLSGDRPADAFEVVDERPALGADPSLSFVVRVRPRGHLRVLDLHLDACTAT